MPAASQAPTPRPLLPAHRPLKWARSAHYSGRRRTHQRPLLFEDFRGSRQLARDGYSILARSLGGGRDGGGGNGTRTRTGSGCRTWPSSGRKCNSERGRGHETGGSGSSRPSWRGDICCSSSGARFRRGRKRVKRPAVTGGLGEAGEGGPPLLESRGSREPSRPAPSEPRPSSQRLALPPSAP